jgi:ribosomal protein S17E
MKLIPLTQGQFSMIDDEDYKEVIKYNWHAQKGHSGYYANSWSKTIKNKKVHMHRLVMNPPENMMIDHVNGNTLDNRKENLRICTNQQNQFNSKKASNNTSGYKGVTHDRGRWKAQIRINGKPTHLGYFNSPEDGHKAYCAAAKKHRGDFFNYG